MVKMEHFIISSPVGPLTLVASDKGLCAVLWENDKPGRVKLPIGRQNLKNVFIDQARRELQEYFCGQRHNFEIPLDLIGTSFQLKVWQELANIPFGATKTYKEMAHALNQPTASRAIGMANGKNPISIIIPCHRVIASSGKVHGYAGGVANKIELLKLEGVFNVR